MNQAKEIIRLIQIANDMTGEHYKNLFKKEKKRKRYYRMMARRGLLKQKKYVPFATHPEYDKITNAEANGEIPRNYYT